MALELLPFTDTHVILFLHITELFPLNVQEIIRNMIRKLNKEFADDVKHLTLRYRIDRYASKWEWTNLSANPNITLRIVLENRHRPWDWHNLTLNVGIPVRDIINHPTLPWAHPIHISMRATFEEVYENMDFDWEWQWLLCLYNVYQQSYVHSIQYHDELIQTAIRDRYLPSMAPYLLIRTGGRDVDAGAANSEDMCPGKFHSVCKYPRLPWNWPKLSKDPKMLLIRTCDRDFQHFRRLNIPKK